MSNGLLAGALRAHGRLVRNRADLGQFLTHCVAIAECKPKADTTENAV
jgi:hypothetical protein